MAGEVRLGELEEARAVRVQRFGRERLDCGLEALVARAAFDRELRLGDGERALQCENLLHAPAALEQRRSHGDEDGERADRETDEQRSDDHRADAR